MEPIGVIICAVIMSIGSVLVIYRSIADLIEVYTTERELPQVLLDVGSGVFMGSVVGLKVVLWLLCRALSQGSLSLDAVAQDHRNDVLSNAVALAAAAVATRWKFLWPLDPIGAILISLWIIWTWVRTGKEQVLHGVGVRVCALHWGGGGGAAGEQGGWRVWGICRCCHEKEALHMGGYWSLPR